MNATLFDTVRAWVAANYPGAIPAQLAIRLQDGRRIKLPVPVPAGAPPGAIFIPTAYQEAILDALDGKALRTGQLAAVTGGDERRLFRKGGLPELRERGLVAHHDRIGFYRPDAPPPELVNPES